MPIFEQLLIGLVLILFMLATTALAIYGLHLYVLLFMFRRRQAEKRAKQRDVIDRFQQEAADADWPAVTTQLPIFNEGEVARRVIEAAARIDYPVGRHEIQVLDDSTDHTRQIVDDTIARLQRRGVDIKAVRRPTREGYKAGALAYGLASARGELVAIFDADFVPEADFLRRAVPLLVDDEGLSCLQGRWDHLNRNESWLTKAQAYGIDGHFAIEQGARSWNGLMMNFNGTAGVWRKAAIEDPAVGGWSGDTLTEDLDLSYRAQLAGWRQDYCLDLPCPAELPNTVKALKSQQRRWATGSIQVARKILPRVWRSKISLAEKVEATFHLTHYSVAVWMLVLALVAWPMMSMFTGRVNSIVFSSWFATAWAFVIIASVAPSLTYIYSRWVLARTLRGMHIIPMMVAMGCGMCLSSGLAVIRGLFLTGGEFVRTPKSGSSGTRKKKSSYQVAQNQYWWVEVLLGVYTGVSFAVYTITNKNGFGVFLLLYAVGFVVIGLRSHPWAHAPRADAEPVPSTVPASAAKPALAAEVEARRPHAPQHEPASSASAPAGSALR